MSDTRDGFITGFLIGVVILGAFKVMWFLTRIAWWLLVFLVLSLGAGLFALTRLGRSEPDEPTGFGRFSQDETRWQDESTGQWYRCSEEQEFCTVQAVDKGFYWRATAISRLMRRGAVCRYKLVAVRDGTSDVVAETEFPHEARHKITLDNLDPALAATDMYDLNQNREWVQKALQELESVLERRGWERVGRPGDQDHWYTRQYRRPVILWNEPIEVPAAA